MSPTTSSRAASPTSTDDLLGDNPVIGWETAADGALAAFAEDDALRRTVHLSRGPTPASVYIEEMTSDLTVHSWDLALATDGDTELDGELVTAALVFAERLPTDGDPGPLRPAAGRAAVRAAAGATARAVRPAFLTVGGSATMTA